MTALEVLRAGRANVKAGWTKGAYRRGQSFCARGAIDAACDQEQWKTKLDARRLFAIAIGTESIEDWNDHPRRTKSEVLGAFDAAMSLALDGADCGDVP